MGPHLLPLALSANQSPDWLRLTETREEVMKGVGVGERVGNSGVEEEDAVQDLSVAKRDPRKKSLNPSQAQFSAGEFSFCVIGNTVR